MHLGQEARAQVPLRAALGALIEILPVYLLPFLPFSAFLVLLFLLIIFPYTPSPFLSCQWHLYVLFIPMGAI